jgi:hypothetical protein
MSVQLVYASLRLNLNGAQCCCIDQRLAAAAQEQQQLDMRRWQGARMACCYRPCIR